MGVPLDLIRFGLGFSIGNHPASWGYPPFMEIFISTKFRKTFVTTNLSEAQLFQVLFGNGSICDDSNRGAEKVQAKTKQSY